MHLRVMHLCATHSHLTYWRVTHSRVTRVCVTHSYVHSTFDPALLTLTYMTWFVFTRDAFTCAWRIHMCIHLFINVWLRWTSSWRCSCLCMYTWHDLFTCDSFKCDSFTRDAITCDVYRCVTHVWCMQMCDTFTCVWHIHVCVTHSNVHSPFYKCLAALDKQLTLLLPLLLPRALQHVWMSRVKYKGVVCVAATHAAHKWVGLRMKKLNV